MSLFDTLKKVIFHNPMARPGSGTAPPRTQGAPRLPRRIRGRQPLQLPAGRPRPHLQRSPRLRLRSRQPSMSKQSWRR
jgi:hypothetical protein